LLRRKQSDAPSSGDHTGQVVRQILVRRDARAIADPDAGERFADAEREVVFGARNPGSQVSMVVEAT
jgi:hypothetical protein